MRRLNEQCSEYIHGCRRQQEDHNYLRGERLKEEKTLANTKQDRKPAKKEFLQRFSQRMFCPNANLWPFQEEMEAKMRAGRMLSCHDASGLCNFATQLH